MASRRYHIIFNASAGTIATRGVSPESLTHQFEANGLVSSIDSDETRSLAARIASALSDPAEIIVAAGGDGTVLAVAEALLGTDKTLAVLPLGTFNGLARDLRLPLDLPGAVAALSALEPRLIDVGEVNGRPFLHNVLVGLIPGIAVGRELMREKAGLLARIGFLRFLLRRLTRARRIAVGLEYDSNPVRVERLQTLMVANNSYEQRLGRFMTRRRIDRGSLTCYIIRSLRVRDALRLGAEMFAGRWRDDEVIEFEKVRTLTVHSKRPKLAVTMDGEIETLDTPLQFRIRPRSLSVLAPAEATAAALGLEMPARASS